MNPSRKDPTKKTPSWLLERLAQGELDASRVEELRARLAAEGRSLDDEVAALARSNQEILAQVDKGQAVAAIRRRAASAALQPARRASFNFWIGPLALAGSLGIGILLLRPGHGTAPETTMPTATSPTATAPADEVTTAKGNPPSAYPRLLVYRHRAATVKDRRPEHLADGAPAARGDLLQLAYTSARDPAYGVLLSIDGAGRVTQHLPEPGARTATPLRSVGEIPLPSAYELDDAPGFERFVLVTSRESFPVAAALDAARALAAQGARARTSPLALSPAFHQTSVVLRKISKGTP